MKKNRNTPSSEDYRKLEFLVDQLYSEAKTFCTDEELTLDTVYEFVMDSLADRLPDEDSWYKLKRLISSNSNFVRSHVYDYLKYRF